MWLHGNLDLRWPINKGRPLTHEIRGGGMKRAFKYRLLKHTTNVVRCLKL